MERKTDPAETWAAMEERPSDSRAKECQVGERVELLPPSADMPNKPRSDVLNAWQGQSLMTGVGEGRMGWDSWESQSTRGARNGEGWGRKPMGGRKRREIPVMAKKENSQVMETATVTEPRPRANEENCPYKEEEAEGAINPSVPVAADLRPEELWGRAYREVDWGRALPVLTTHTIGMTQKKAKNGATNLAAKCMLSGSMPAAC